MATDKLPVTHTPGPWAVASTGEVVSTVEMAPNPSYGRAVVWHGSEVHRISEEDARLIAAAPEMLEALSALDALMEFSENIIVDDGSVEFEFQDATALVKAFEKAKQAIQKARGL